VRIKTWQERCKSEVTMSYELYHECALEEIKDLRTEIRRLKKELAKKRRGEK